MHFFGEVRKWTDGWTEHGWVENMTDGRTDGQTVKSCHLTEGCFLRKDINYMYLGPIGVFDMAVIKAARY